MLAVALVLSFTFPEATRPDPLPDEAGCEHYKGTSSGNDPSVQLDVILCPHEDGTPGKLQGKVQWSSLESGWNVRKVEGTRSQTGLTMKDLEILEEKPEPGYRFCTIDTYALEDKDGGKLEGTYDSEDCSDHASVTLTKVQASPGGAVALPSTGEAPPAPEADGEELPERDEDPEPSAEPSKPPRDSKPPREDKQDDKPKAGCGCDVTLLGGPLMLVGLRRRRRDLGDAVIS